MSRLTDSKDPFQQIGVQIGALHKLTDAMLAGRYAARMAKVEHPEKLTRTELREK